MRFRLWLEDLDTLKANTAAAFPDTQKRQHVAADVAEPKVAITPDRLKRELFVRAITPGSQGVYNTSILFNNVRFKTLPDNGQMAFDGYLLANPKTGEKHYIEKLSFRHDVKVNCTCPDFQYRFAKHNHDAGALHGDNPPGETTRNPQKLPGLCKHLIRLTQYLEDKGILTQNPW